MASTEKPILRPFATTKMQQQTTICAPRAVYKRQMFVKAFERLRHPPFDDLQVVRDVANQSVCDGSN